MVLDVVVSMSIVVANTGPLYTLAATIGSLAAGFSPAVQALALDIYTNRRSENRGEVGKLFGALSVVQALAYVFPFASLGASFVADPDC